MKRTFVGKVVGREMSKGWDMKCHVRLDVSIVPTQTYEDPSIVHIYVAHNHALAKAKQFTITVEE